MGDGYKVATQDLRSFAGQLNKSGEAAGKLASPASAKPTELDFPVPVVGLFYKSALNNARQEVLDALRELHNNLTDASTKLIDVANNYQKAEDASGGKP
jgi:hypothetical protein